jgi:hypothetical protein
MESELSSRSKWIVFSYHQNHREIRLENLLLFKK